MKTKFLGALLISASFLSACVPAGISQQSSDNGRYVTTQITAYSGRAGDVIQSALLIWDKSINQYVINTMTGSAPLSDLLLRDLLSIGVGAVVSGEYGLRIASAGSCQKGRVCGDWIHVEANSGSESTAGAGAVAISSKSPTGVFDKMSTKKLNAMLRDQLQVLGKSGKLEIQIIS